MERCPKCNSIFIQVDNIVDKLYCLVKACGYRWHQSLIRKEIENDYLRISMYKEEIK